MSTKPLPPCPVCGSPVRHGHYKDRPFSHKCDGSLDECRMSHGFALCSDEYRDLCASVEQKEAQLAAAEKRCAEMEKQIAELKPLAAPVWPGPERGQGGDDEQQ